MKQLGNLHVTFLNILNWIVLIKLGEEVKILIISKKSKGFLQLNENCAKDGKNQNYLKTKHILTEQLSSYEMQ